MLCNFYKTCSIFPSYEPITLPVDFDTTTLTPPTVILVLPTAACELAGQHGNLTTAAVVA